MEIKQNTICICGIGPGNPDYITPIVYKKVAQADVLIGGKRHLGIVDAKDKEMVVFNGKLNELQNAIEKINGKNIVMVVSGDTGFYSLRRFIINAFPNMAIELIPGISSYQYFYAKLGLGYENAFKASLHGKELNFLDKVKEYDSVFLLTDKKNNWKVIAQQLNNNGMGDVNFHFANNLSYANETIISTTPSKALLMEHDFSLCSVIINK